LNDRQCAGADKTGSRKFEHSTAMDTRLAESWGCLEKLSFAKFCDCQGNSFLRRIDSTVAELSGDVVHRTLTVTKVPNLSRRLIEAVIVHRLGVEHDHVIGNGFRENAGGILLGAGNWGRVRRSIDDVITDRHFRSPHQKPPEPSKPALAWRLLIWNTKK
jgi:hypothetical protein